MANPHLEMMKQNRAQQKAGQLAGRHDVQNLGSLAAMAKQRYDLQAGAPDPRQNVADMLGQSAKEVTGGGSAAGGRPAGSRPARGWRALLSGMLEGASVGLKGKVSQEKKEEAAKVGHVFEWLEANGMAMAEQNKHNDLKRRAEEELEPLLKDYAQNMMRMAPLAKEKYVEHILGRLNETTGSDYELSSIDQVNPLKITVKSPQNGNALFVQDFSKRVGGVNADLYQKAIDFENQKLDQENQRIVLARQNADAIQNRNAFSQDPQAQHDVILGKEQAKALAKKQAALSEQNLAFEEVTYKIQDLKEILKNSTLITGDTLSAGFERLIGKHLGTKSYSDTELYDAISKGLLSFVKGNLAFGNMNQKEFEFLTAQTPNSHKTKEALTRMLNRFETTLDRQMKRNEREINKSPRYGTRDQITLEEPRQVQMPVQPQQRPQEQIQSNQSIQPNQSSPPQQAEMVRMIAPDGTAVLIPAANVDLAMRQGARLVD